MAETLVSLLGDSVEPVRTNAAECLGTMMKILGERAFNPYIEGVAEIQMAKVKDAFARAEIKYKAGGGKPASKTTSSAPKAPPVGVKKAPTARAPVSATPSSPPIKSSAGYDLDALEDFSSQPVKAPPARFAKPGAAKPAAAPAPIKRPAPTPAAAPPVAAKAPPPAKAGAAKTLAVSPTEPVKYKYNPEDAVAQAAEIIPAAYQTQLADGAWKVRLEAAEAMVKWYEDGAAETVDAEIMMRFLSKTPGWGEKNFQVSGIRLMTLGPTYSVFRSLQSCTK
jgi:cytoskeleton-associated protein 5